MNPDDIVKNIVFNEGIRSLLMDVLKGSQPPREHPFRQLVECQRDAYACEGLSIETEGFQVGEPWNGDIANARVAFISSNPAFNPREDFPRYHAATGTLSMLDGREITADGAGAFFEHRFENAHITDGGGLQVKCLDQGTGASYYSTVSYWGCVRNSMESLWPNAKSPGDSTEVYVKRLMSGAVSMELVPFKSSGEKGVVEALPTCLRNFTRHILPHIAAPIIVLVGKKVRRAFMGYAITDEKEWGKAKQAFDNSEAYRYNGPLFNGEKLVVSVKFAVGSFSLSNSCLPSTLRELQAAFVGGTN
jgi:hypothetical protein